MFASGNDPGEDTEDTGKIDRKDWRNRSGMECRGSVVGGLLREEEGRLMHRNQRIKKLMQA